jgi:hypothetical protein
MSSVLTGFHKTAHLHDSNTHYFSVPHIFLPCRNVIFESETFVDYEIDFRYEVGIPLIINKPILVEFMC